MIYQTLVMMKALCYPLRSNKLIAMRNYSKPSIVTDLVSALHERLVNAPSYELQIPGESIPHILIRPEIEFVMAMR